MNMKKNLLFFTTICIIGCMKSMAQSYDYVDLALPSKTLWATCNLGAKNPYENGEFFAWGETKSKQYFSSSNYKYCNGSLQKLTKYNTSSSYGQMDNKRKLELSDDAAYVISGGKLRMPTQKQLEELMNHCIWTWDDIHHGFYIKSKINNNSIFLPLAGYTNQMDSYLRRSIESAKKAYYWSCEECHYLCNSGLCVELSYSEERGFSGSINYKPQKNIAGLYRFSGLPIRPVVFSEENEKQSSVFEDSEVEKERLSLYIYFSDWEFQRNWLNSKKANDKWLFNCFTPTCRENVTWNNERNIYTSPFNKYGHRGISIESVGQNNIIQIGKGEYSIVVTHEKDGKKCSLCKYIVKLVRENGLRFNEIRLVTDGHDEQLLSK